MFPICFHDMFPVASRGLAVRRSLSSILLFGLLLAASLTTLAQETSVWVVPPAR